MEKDVNTPETKSAVKEFLLEEYRYITQLFLKSEEIGETRVNWFIGIVTAAVGGLVVLSTKKTDGVNLSLVLMLSFFSLLALGLVTLCRILKRNEVSDGYKKDCDRIREIFQGPHFDGRNVLRDYGSFGRKKNKDKQAKGRQFGGLAHLVAVINSLLFGASCVVFANSVFGLGDSSPGALAIFAFTFLMAFAIALSVQLRYVRKREERATERLRHD